MKSPANAMLDIAVGILKDVQRAYPEYGGVVRDIERLSLLVRTRGLNVFTLDLPSLDGSLTKALEVGRLDLGGPVSKRASKKTKVPRLFQGLWLRVFSRDSCLRDDVDINAVFFLRQLCCLGKKYFVECSKKRFENSLEEYYNVENSLPVPSLRWVDDELDPDDVAFDLHCGDLLRDHGWFGESVSWDGTSFDAANHSSDWTLVQRFQQNADCVAECLGEFDPTEFSGSIHEQRGRGIGHRHGRGAVSRLKGKFMKYDFANWPEKLHGTFPYQLHGAIASAPSKAMINHEYPSELIAVPKTAKSPRLIACEPVEHQWCQQLTWTFIQERLQGLFGSNFIDFKDQEASRAMALRASLKRDLATVDLSSASDRLSCYVIERVFRRNPSLLRALHASRTRYVEDTLSKPHRFLIPRKFASQGTAVTFPIQTIVFFIAALTSVGVTLRKPSDLYCVRGFEGIVGRYRNRIRVFGDDIIIPTHGYAALVRLLTLLRLKVNEEKSFHRGYFREACGMDAYKGHCVTPVRPVSLSADGPTLRNSLVDFSNNLFNKGLWNAAESVRSTVGIRHPFWRRLPIVGRRSGVIGLTSFVGSSDEHLRRRYNHKLQRWEVRAWRFTSKCGITQTNDYPGLLQYFTEAPASDHWNPVIWKHGYQGRPRTSDGLRWEDTAVIANL
nr:MAG: hypothetical protein 3 [Leviviridae sp.]